VIAVQLSGGAPFSEEEINRSPVAPLSRSLDIMTAQNVQRQLPQASYVLNVDLSGYKTADFLRGSDILAIGEKAAREHRADFEELKARILGLGGLESRVQRPAATPLGAVAVEGVGGDEKARALALLQPLAGGVPGAGELTELLAALERRGDYKEVRLSRAADAQGSTLVLRLEKNQPRGNVARLGFSAEASYAQSVFNKDVIRSGVVFHGLPTPESKLAIDCTMGSQPGLEITFLQPIGGLLFSELSTVVTTDTDTFFTDDSESYSVQVDRRSVALRLGLCPSNWTEIALGLRYDQIPSASTYLGVLAGPEIDSVAIGTMTFKLLLLDSFIFPLKGVSLSASYLAGLPEVLDSRGFQVFETSGCLAFSASVPLSFELEWLCGTDFSEWGNDVSAAPACYKPAIAKRRMFSGVMKTEECVGSHVAGLSVLGKYRLARSSSSLGVPAFALLHGSIGTVLQNYAQVEALQDYSTIQADWGLGLRLSDAFGLSMRVGASRGFDGAFDGFVAIDLGAFGAR
jgi:NTE family protein